MHHNAAELHVTTSRTELATETLALSETGGRVTGNCLTVQCTTTHSTITIVTIVTRGDVR